MKMDEKKKLTLQGWALIAIGVIAGWHLGFSAVMDTGAKAAACTALAAVQAAQSDPSCSDPKHGGKVLFAWTMLVAGFTAYSAGVARIGRARGRS
jgi:MFS superfamily sulfate permease-like transporter